MQVGTLFEQQEDFAGLRTIPELRELALHGLTHMYVPKQSLFCQTYVRTKSGMQRQGISHRYTMMSLLGLHRLERFGGQSPVPIEPVLRKMVDNTDWITCAGDLGLLLWTCGEILPENVPAVFRQVCATEALSRFSDAQQGYTMEVAWLLTGLTACCEAGFTDLPGMSELIEATRRILSQNCDYTGIYGHRSADGTLAGYARHRIGSFADQVYPTIAFARLSQVFHDSEARDMAIRTAVTICDLQGPLGEWFWRYDARTGRVVSRYPVYSVHQHAMGPMMLFAVSEATGYNFNDAVRDGLTWISGENEMRRSFVEPSLGLVWRCIYLGSVSKYFDSGFRLLYAGLGASKAGLKVRYECRPYELGWLLYAFAGK
jgi:hypothetical protein